MAVARKAKDRMEKKPGDCYLIHGQAIAVGRKTGVLCHGTVWHHSIGWHSHAWIEEGDTVYDMANGRDASFHLPKDFYYIVGYVRDVKRYTQAETKAAMLKSGSFGPWESKDKED